MPEPSRPLRGDAVRHKAHALISQSRETQANLSFFLVLLVLIGFVLPAMGFAREDERRYSDIGFTVLLISGAAIAWGHRRLMALSGLVGSVAIAVRWTVYLKPNPTLALWADGATLVAILVIALVLLTQIFRKGPVNSYRIQGAIAVYLLFGSVWAHAYHIVAVLHPGSFNVPGRDMSSAVEWLYYSFVTLTTVGYGDITAELPIARMLSVGEALTGQLYLAVLIARLVAMEVVSWQESGDQKSR